MVAFRSCCSSRSKLCCPSGARGYYELAILETDAVPQYGFASAAFTRVSGASDDGVGDDNKSWEVDGARKCKWHSGKRGSDTCEWKVGDVLGLACDLEDMHMYVSVNGCFDVPNGLVLHLNADNVQRGLFAAFSGSSGKVRCNLGAAPFQHALPLADFKAFVDFHDGVTQLVPTTLVSAA